MNRITPVNRIVPSLRLVRVATKLRELPAANAPVVRNSAEILVAPLYRGTCRRKRGTLPF